MRFFLLFAIKNIVTNILLLQLVILTFSISTVFFIKKYKKDIFVGEIDNSRAPQDLVNDSRVAKNLRQLRSVRFADLIWPHYISISAVIQLSLHTNNPWSKQRENDRFWWERVADIRFRMTTE